MYFFVNFVILELSKKNQDVWRGIPVYLSDGYECDTNNRKKVFFPQQSKKTNEKVLITIIWLVCTKFKAKIFNDLKKI